MSSAITIKTDINKLQGILGSNLYTSPYAFISEIAQNATDSMRRAGKADEHIIARVGWDEEEKKYFFSIRDYGVSFKDKEEYIKYCCVLLESSKSSVKTKEEDQEIGKWGIGKISPSAFNKEWFYNIYREGKGFDSRVWEVTGDGIFHEESDYYDTDEKDGVLFKIYLKDGIFGLMLFCDNMVNKLCYFQNTYFVYDYEVNEALARHTNYENRVVDNDQFIIYEDELLKVSSIYHGTGIHIVQDQYHYALDDRSKKIIANVVGDRILTYDIGIKVGLDEVDVSSTRETLKLNDAFYDTIISKAEELKERIKQVTEEIRPEEKVKVKSFLDYNRICNNIFASHVPLIKDDTTGRSDIRLKHFTDIESYYPLLVSEEEETIEIAPIIGAMKDKYYFLNEFLPIRSKISNNRLQGTKRAHKIWNDNLDQISIKKESNLILSNNPSEVNNSNSSLFINTKKLTKEKTQAYFSNYGGDIYVYSEDFESKINKMTSKNNGPWSIVNYDYLVSEATRQSVTCKDEETGLYAFSRTMDRADKFDFIKSQYKLFCKSFKNEFISDEDFIEILSREAPEEEIIEEVKERKKKAVGEIIKGTTAIVSQRNREEYTSHIQYVDTSKVDRSNTIYFCLSADKIDKEAIDRLAKIRSIVGLEDNNRRKKASFIYISKRNIKMVSTLNNFISLELEDNTYRGYNHIGKLVTSVEVNRLKRDYEHVFTNYSLISKDISKQFGETLKKLIDYSDANFGKINSVESGPEYEALYNEFYTFVNQNNLWDKSIYDELLQARAFLEKAKFLNVYKLTDTNGCLYNYGNEEHEFEEEIKDLVINNCRYLGIRMNWENYNYKPDGNFFKSKPDGRERESSE